MELRTLRYFLAVAREESITRAAERLHLTQPNLSRQLRELEEELGTTLFIRGRGITLTEEGQIFRKRAEEMMGLLDKARTEVAASAQDISGDIYIGCAETDAMRIVLRMIKKIRDQYPGIHIHLTSGHEEVVAERLDRGLLDFGVFMEPTDMQKYEFVHLPATDTWGILMRKDDPLAMTPSIRPRDLVGLPLICSNQELFQNQLAGWSGKVQDKMDIIICKEDMKKETSMYICRLKNQLRQIFPQYLPLFSKVNGKASLEVLSHYPSPSAVLSAGADALAKLIQDASGKGKAMAEKRAEAILSAAREALSFGHGNSGITFLIGHYVEMIRILDEKTAALLKQIKRSVQEQPDSLLARQTRLLESIPGAGFLTAITIVCEIGDFRAFRRPKQLYSYFGLDPVVRQSGNSAGANLRISKRGSPYAHRCFYILALQSVSLRKNGEPKNPILRAYYLDKCKSKAKMTALGAIMHKLCNIVFAVLRDERPFVLISPQEHRQNYLSLPKAA